MSGPQSLKALEMVLLQTLVLRHNHLSCERQSDCAFMTSSDTPLPHLRTLDLADNLLISSDDPNGGGGVAGVRFQADVFPAVVELDVTANRLTAVVVGAFGNLARLQTLRLSDNPISDIESGALDGLTALTRLELDRCTRLTHLKAGALAGLVRLRVLSAHDSGLVHLHHAALSHLTHLEELYLRNNHLGDQVLTLHHYSKNGRSSLNDKFFLIFHVSILVHFKFYKHQLDFFYSSYHAYHVLYTTLKLQFFVFKLHFLYF